MLKWYRIFPATNSKKLIMLDSEFNVNTSLHCHRNERLSTWNCHASCYNKKAVSLTTSSDFMCETIGRYNKPTWKEKSEIPVKIMTVWLLYIYMYLYIYKMKKSHSKPPNTIKCRTGIPAGLSFKEFSKWVVQWLNRESGG